MRIKTIRLIGCIILLNSTVHAFDLYRYCCCLEMFKNRSARASFASTNTRNSRASSTYTDTTSNCDDFCYEQMLDGQTVLTFIENPTKQNRSSGVNTANQNKNNNSQAKGGFNANQSNNFTYRFTQRNSMGIFHGNTEE